MMGTPIAVYRSSHPHVLQVWSDFTERNTAFKIRVREFLDQCAPGFDAMSVTGLRDKRITGIAARESDEPPKGWRRPARFDGILKPDRRTHLGKEIARQMNKLAIRDPRYDLPGMPGLVVVGHYWYHPSVRLMDGYLYVAWSTEIESPFAEDWSTRGPLDTEVWARVPLSEYHALLGGRVDGGTERV